MTSKLCKGDKCYGCFYGKVSGTHVLHAYVDASLEYDVLTRSSTSGILTYLGNHLVDLKVRE